MVGQRIGNDQGQRGVRGQCSREKGGGMLPLAWSSRHSASWPPLSLEVPMNFATLNKKWFHEVNISVTIPLAYPERARTLTHTLIHQRSHTLINSTKTTDYYEYYDYYYYYNYYYMLLLYYYSAEKTARERRSNGQTEPRANQVLWPVAFPITLRLGSPGVQTSAGVVSSSRSYTSAALVPSNPRHNSSVLFGSRPRPRVSYLSRIIIHSFITFKQLSTIHYIPFNKWKCNQCFDHYQGQELYCIFHSGELKDRKNNIRNKNQMWTWRISVKFQRELTRDGPTPEFDISEIENHSEKLSRDLHLIHLINWSWSGRIKSQGDVPRDVHFDVDRLVEQIHVSNI